MISVDFRPQVVRDVKIDIEFQDLVRKIQMSVPKPAIINAAKSTLKKIKGQWQPAFVFQWVKYSSDPEKGTGTLTLDDGTGLEINLGHSARFMNAAGHALAAVYTAGPQMDELSAAASDAQDFMALHFIDLIGLLVLEKTELIVKKEAEDTAQKFGWGVSPFLSPGSVHGWELQDQVNLTSFLPTQDIGIRLSKAGVFSPFKTISCLIGIGPGYENHKVGTTCRVCSRRETCTMRQTHNTGQAS